jgi:hypothetical protein
MRDVAEHAEVALLSPLPSNGQGVVQPRPLRTQALAYGVHYLTMMEKACRLA